MKWFQQSHHNFLNINDTLCFQAGLGFVTVAHVNLQELDEKCFPPTSYTLIIASISSGCGALFLVVVILLSCKCYSKFHWSVRYLFYKIFGPEFPVPEKEYDYDGLIVYSSDDREWVHDTLIPEMETKRNLKLYIYLRDAPSGTVLADSIGEGMKQARKTVIVLSPNFLRSEWCQFDLRMAETRLADEGLDVLVPVLLRPLPRNGINEAVARLLKTHQSIQWTDHPQGQKLFFDKLQYELTTKPRRPLRK